MRYTIFLTPRILHLFPLMTLIPPISAATEVYPQPSTPSLEVRIVLQCIHWINHRYAGSGAWSLDAVVVTL
jgi:hypothetical protein